MSAIKNVLAQEYDMQPIDFSNTAKPYDLKTQTGSAQMVKLAEQTINSMLRENKFEPMTIRQIQYLMMLNSWWDTLK